MQDWLEDPENRIAYEQFLEDCEEPEAPVRRRRDDTQKRQRTGSARASRTTGTSRTAGASGTGRGNAERGRTARLSVGGATRRRSSRRRRRRRRGGIRGLLLRAAAVIAVLALLFLAVRRLGGRIRIPFLTVPGTEEAGTPQQGAEDMQETENEQDRWYGAPGIDVQLLTPNEHSRPQIPLTEVNGIVVHYTANPGSTAQANRNYFENLKDTGENDVSSHFVIGLDGEIIQCIPCDEVAYASNERNSDTISIECCHPDETGKFNDATYDSLVRLTAWLCKDRGITSKDVIRHYDVTGKDCPRYFVQNEDAWTQFRQDVQERLDALNAGTL